MTETNSKTKDSGWEGLYILGGVAALAFVLVVLLDIVTSVMGGEAPGPGTLNAGDWFALFHNHPYSAFQNLGIFNIIEQTLMIAIMFALYIAHRQVSKITAALAIITNFIGTAIYLSNNAAIPLYFLSGKYAAATTDIQKSVLLGAGQAILARGEDFTPGAFLGFFFLSIASITISFVMLRDNIFSKAAAYTGIIGTIILSIFTVWATFIPAYYNAAMIFAMFGGLLSMAWLILIARRLFQLK